MGQENQGGGYHDGNYRDHTNAPAGFDLCTSVKQCCDALTEDRFTDHFNGR